MKALEELTREIREKLPRLMELSDGQRLITLISDEPNDIYEGAYERIGIGADLLENGNIEIGGYEYEIGKAFQVVGKDPMLNDVLEYLQIKGIEYAFTQNGFYYFDYSENVNAWSDFFNINLSSPYLKDQYPELIKFLHGLIKK